MRAREEGKVVFAVATADWCPPCQTYKRNALVDDGVAAWLDEHAVTLTIDLSNRSEPNPDAIALGVSPIPETFLISAEGEVLARAVGALKAPDLRAWLASHTPG